jgi:hypothetical protein
VARFIITCQNRPGCTELYPMTCQNSFDCNGKKNEEMTAYCGTCNERGHPTCMIEMPKTIKLHAEQKDGAKTFRLIPQLCGLCDKYHGLFYRVCKKCEDLLLRLNQQALGDVSDGAVVQATTPTLSARPTSSNGGDGEGGLSVAVPSPTRARIIVGGKPRGRGKGKSLTRGRGRGTGGNPSKRGRLQ